MFRLRFYCPFGGYGYNVFLIGIVLVIISFLMTAINDGNIIAAVMIPAFTVLIGGYIRANRITGLDKRNMDKAELPLWRPLTDDERGKLMKTKSRSIIFYIIIFVAVVLFLIVPPRGGRVFVDRLTMSIGVVTLIAIAVVLILDYINCLRWKNIDDTALCAVVPVHLHFSVEHHSRRNGWTDDYIVIYLPDGKYALKSYLAGSQTVKLVRYGGMLTYFEDDANNDVIM